MRLCNRPNCKEPACQQVGSGRFGRLCKAHAAAMRERSQKDKTLPKCKICGGGSVAKKGSDFCSRHQPFDGAKITFVAFDEFKHFIDNEMYELAADLNVPLEYLTGQRDQPQLAINSSTRYPGNYKIWFGPQYGAPGRWALCSCDKYGVWRGPGGMYMPEPKPSQFENKGV